MRNYEKLTLPEAIKLLKEYDSDPARELYLSVAEQLSSLSKLVREIKLKNIEKDQDKIDLILKISEKGERMTKSLKTMKGVDVKAEEADVDDGFISSMERTKYMTEAQLECAFAYKNFKRTRNLSKEIPDCSFDIDMELPAPPPIEEIANYGVEYEKRTFPYYDTEKVKKLSKKQGVAFRDKEWPKRRNGFWFFNGPNLEYVTGKHYMFLQYWTVEGDVVLEDGTSDVLPRQPDFIDFQRDWYYALNWVVENPNSFGLLFPWP